MNRTVPFVGGPLDGETRIVSSARNEVLVRDNDGGEITYLRGSLNGETQTFEIFYLSGWTGDDVVRHLLKKAQA